MNRAARRAAVLREMGLAPLWRLRTATAAEDPPDPLPVAAPAGLSAEAPAAVPMSPGPAPAEPARRTPRASIVPGRAAAPAAPVIQPPVPAAHRAPEPSRIATLDWDQLETAIADCRGCGLCEKRRRVVPGVGDRQGRWLFVGEGPGAEEDARGEPFVGQAGKLLDAMLAALGLRRGEDMYIANAVKCRPPLNRTPTAAEIAACLPFLQRQIALLEPRIIVALGRPAAQALLDREVSIAAARGKVFRYGEIPVVVTYHPAYLLRNPADKRKAWEDLCHARRVFAGGPGQ